MKKTTIKPLRKRKIMIVGAGPGGLASSLLLAHQGHHVTIFETNDRPGGRSSLIEVDGYRFDAGPTFFIYRYVLDEIFTTIGKKLEDYVSLTPLNPLYELIFPNKTFRPYQDHSKMMKEIHRVFPGEENGYQLYLKKEAIRLKTLLPVLQLPFHSPLQFFNLKVLSALSEIDLGKSLYQRLKHYFHSEELIYSMAFQAKYLGMSPWDCPSIFSMLSYMEHEYGVFHIHGGIHALHEAMASLAISMGVKIKYNHPVQKLIVKNKHVSQLIVKNKSIACDMVVMNGDFSKTIRLIDNKDRPKSYRDANLTNKGYSCSTFNLYLGLDKVFPLAHHTIVFSKDYRRYVEELSKTFVLSEDPSFYIHNPSLIDETYAPPHHSALYVLVPVPNLKASIDWNRIKDSYVQKTIQRLSRVPGLKDLAKHIVTTRVVSPLDWQQDYHVAYGANFNLTHDFKQLLYFRPHNQFQGFKNLYLVGGGTHPGSGLPTIYQSAIIVANLIKKTA